MSNSNAGHETKVLEDDVLALAAGQGMPVRMPPDELKVRLRMTQKMETLGRLASGIAHDFNNHLTVVCGYSEFLLDPKIQKTAADQQFALEEIHKAGIQAAALTRLLMAFRLGKPSSPVLMDLGARIAELEPVLRRLLGKSIPLVFNRTPGPGYILADPDQIEQVLLNLLLNARDALPQGGQMTIEVGHVFLDNAADLRPPTTPPGPYVVFSVVDTGRGMTEEAKAHLFEPFFTTKEPGKGTGLGLAITWDIVQQARGAIQVVSVPNQGTTVRVFWPRIEADVATTVG